MWSAHEPYVLLLNHATVHRQREDDLHDLHFLCAPASRSSKHHVQKKPPPSNAKIFYLNQMRLFQSALPMVKKEKKKKNKRNKKRGGKEKNLRDILLNKDLFGENLNLRFIPLLLKYKSSMRPLRNMAENNSVKNFFPQYFLAFGTTLS